MKELHFRLVRTSQGFAIQIRKWHLFWDTIEKYFNSRSECYNSFVDENKDTHKLVEHSETNI